MDIYMECYNLKSFKEKDLYTWDEIISILEEQEFKIGRLEDKISSLENDIKENYREISTSEQIGIYNSDFI